MKVYHYEPKQGPIIGEYEDEGADEIQGYHDFKTNEILMNASHAFVDDRDFPHEGNTK